MEPMQVSGNVEPGFESIKTLFTRQMRQFAEDRAQLCVYHEDRKVVDLWCGPSDDPRYDGDTLTNIFSSGKSLESIAMAWLVSEGLLDFNAKVTEYWPEYGSHGKGDQTVADVMRHEAGLPHLDQSIEPFDLHRESIKDNRVGALIAQQSPKYRSPDMDDRREYHPLTRGWIVNEIFRRVDAHERTLGEFYADFIDPLLDTDIFIGVDDKDLGRIARLKLLPIIRHLRFSAWPLKASRQTHNHLFELLARIITFAYRAWQTRGQKIPPPFKGMSTINSFNDRNIIQGETASANAHASARGLAKLGAIIALGGSGFGHQLLTPEAWTALHDNPIDREMGVITAFTEGGICKFKPLPPGANATSRSLHHGRQGFFGWMGLGGSIFQWHPSKKLSFAFVPTSLHLLDVVNERGKTLQSALLDCL